MKHIDFKQDVLPHLIAVAVFYVVTIAFFSPVIFEGKTLPQHDIKQAAGGAQELSQYYNENGEETLWTNSMFGGMPTYFMGVRYSGELTVYVHKIMGLFLPHPVRLLFIAFVCCYIMMLSFGTRPWVAIAAGLAFGLTEFSIIGLMAGHNAKIAAVSFMPLVLAGIHLAFNRKRILGFVLTAMGLALQLRANHLQITYYLLIIIMFYGVALLIDSIRNKTLPDFTKTTGVLIFAAIVAVGCNFGRMWTAMEYSNYSTRGKTELTSLKDKKSGLDLDYAFYYSNGIFEPLVLFIPNFYGGSTQEDLGKNSNLEEALRRNGATRQQIKSSVENAPAYWGEQPGTAPYYAGAIVVFLFVLSLLVLDKKYKYWILSAVVFGVMMSWGKNFLTLNELMFDYFPGYNKFRSVTFTIIIPVLCMILAGFFALEKILSSVWDKTIQKKFLIALGITGGFALLCILFAGLGSYKGAIDARLTSYPDWYLNALRADRASLLRSDAFRSLFFVVAFAAVMWFAVKQKLSNLLAGVLVILLILIDMFSVSKRFINGDSFVRIKNTEFVLSEADKTILTDKTLDYRVLNLMGPFNEAATSYFHKSVGGYHGAKMGRYQDLIENALSPEQSSVVSALQGGNYDFGYTGVIDMLNTKYFKVGDAANAVIPNNEANGNAWYVKEIKLVQSADEEMATLKEINTKNTAVIDQTQFNTPAVEFDSLSSVVLTEYKPNKLTYKSRASKDGLVVFSEIYYAKGWKATIDGVESDILRANYVLRAMNVPAGEHLIEFEFRPKSYYLGNTVTLIFNIFLIMTLIAAITLPLLGKSVA